MPLTIHLNISILIVILLLLIMYILKMKFKPNFSVMSSVECGFNSLYQKKFKFPNQFFMVAILFVIFDMELVAILPIPITLFNTKNLFILSSILIILAFSILMEWINGLIEWIKS